MDQPSKKSSNARALLDALFAPTVSDSFKRFDEPDVIESSAEPQDRPSTPVAPAVVRPVPTTYKKTRFSSLPPDVQASVRAKHAAKY